MTRVWAAHGVQGRPGWLAQATVLARASAARVLYNEVTGAASGMDYALAWLLAFVAAPGLFFPFHLSFGWQHMLAAYGADRLWVLTRDMRTLYFGCAMAAAGALSAVVWNALLVSRRDAVILGSLPVRAPTLVVARMGTIGTLALGVCAAMHVLAAPWFGLLGAYAWGLGGLRIMAATFAAGTTAGLTVVAAALAVQGTLLAVLGPRRFRRAAPLAQMAFAAGVVGLLLSLPSVAHVAPAVLDGAPAPPWLSWMPPLWFVGLQEAWSGMGGGAARALGDTALRAFGALTLTALVMYPLASARMMRGGIEESVDGSRVGVAARLARLIAARAPGGDAATGIASFVMVTCWRSERHRLVTALALAVAMAWQVPAVLGLVETWPRLPVRPDAWLVAMPLSVMAILLAGLRVAAACPADPRASWVFASTHVPARAGARGLARVMAAFIVVPVVSVAVSIAGAVWGAGEALRVGGLLAAFGWLAVEVATWRVTVPCVSGGPPVYLHLRWMWPGYLAAFALTCGSQSVSLAGLAAGGAHRPWSSVALTVAMLGAAAALAMRARRGTARGDEDVVDDGGDARALLPWRDLVS